MLKGEMWQCSHSECPAMCICNMLLSSLCHAKLLKSDWLEGWMGGFWAYRQDVVPAAFLKTELCHF